MRLNHDVTTSDRWVPTPEFLKIDSSSRGLRGLVVILDGSLFYVTVSFSFLLVYDTSKKKVVFFPLKLKA